jgi:hypothetical protein
MDKNEILFIVQQSIHVAYPTVMGKLFVGIGYIFNENIPIQIVVDKPSSHL